MLKSESLSTLSLAQENLTAEGRDARKWQVAQDFESMFVHQMFQAMRKTVPQGGITEESNGRRIFTEMLDTEMAKKASQQGFGLAEIIYRQLEGKADVPNPKLVLQNYTPSATRATSTRVDALVQEAANAHGLDPALLKSVVQQESAGNSLAKSPKGAMGLTQLMPATAKEMGVENPWDARQNLMGGARYLKKMLDHYNGDEAKALAAYNAGPGNVDKYGGIPPFTETRQYVKSVLARKARNTEVEDAG